MKRIFLNLTLVLFVIPFGISQDLPSYVPTDGLVAYYPFNGNANDASGNGNDGVNTGAVLTIDRHGNSDSAFYFSGSSCSTRIDADVDMSSVLSSMSVSMWVNRNGNGCYNPRLFDFYDGGNNSNDWGEVWFNGANLFNLSGSGYSDNDKWYNITIIINNSENSRKYFIDGNLVNNIPNTKTLPLAGDFSIGRMNHPAYDAFNGIIDDFGIWNRALTEQEIQNLYNSSTGDIILNGVVSAEDNQIKNVGDPTEAQDAVTKSYTDTKFYTQSEVDALIANLQQQINEMNQAITSSELEGNWNVKELYYLNPDTNEITSTFPTPECSKPYQYYEFLVSKEIFWTGIGTNWVTQSCTSNEFGVKQDPYTITTENSYGDDPITYINFPNGSNTRNWEIISRPSENTIIIRAWQNNEVSLYNNQVHGIKLVKEPRIESSFN